MSFQTSESESLLLRKLFQYSVSFPPLLTLQPALIAIFLKEATLWTLSCSPPGLLLKHLNSLKNMPAYGSSGFFIGTTPSCKVYQEHSHPLPSLFPASQNTLHSPEAPFLASLNPPSGHGSSSTPSLHPSFHLPSLPSQCYDASERTAPYMVIQKGQNGSATLTQSQSKVQYDTVLQY